jgi:toxic protein SymE
MIGASSFTAGKKTKNSTMMNSRKIKIHTRYQKSNRQMITVPEIRLQGKWLDALGFGKGKTVHIQQKKNKLTITVAK